jgi:hypothetical protein
MKLGKLSKIKLPLTLASILTLAGCGSNEDIPDYDLGDLQLRTYQGNERLTFSVLGTHNDGNGAPIELDGELFISWATSEQTIIPGSSAADTLISEQWQSNIANMPLFFMQRHFWQDDNASIHYFGIQLEPGGEVFWAFPRDDAINSGIETLSSPLETGSNPLNYDLWRCNTNSCSEKVATAVETYTYNKTEKIQTPYANFETMRYAHALAISNEPNSDVDLNITVSGSLWIYPPLGPVKMSRHINHHPQDGISQSSITALLAATNTKLNDD